MAFLNNLGALTLATSTLLATGCGAIMNGAGEGVGLRSLKGEKLGRGEAHGQRGGKGGPGGFGFFGGVTLTAEQQAQVKAIHEKYKPAAPTDGAPADFKAKREAVQAAMQAEPFDAAALEAALKAAQPPQHRAPKAEMLVELRAVLTEAQRAEAVAKLEAVPARQAPPKVDRPDPTARLAEMLKLTDAQKEKLAALQAARPQHEPGDRKAAMIAFLKTGDASQLTPPAPPAPPVAELVAFVGSLDASQRKALASSHFPMFGGPGFGRGGHGKGWMGGGRGKGGHGMRRGGHPHEAPVPSPSPAV